MLSSKNGKGSQICMPSALSTADGLLPEDLGVRDHVEAFDGCGVKMSWQKGQVGASAAVCF